MSWTDDLSNNSESSWDKTAKVKKKAGRKALSADKKRTKRCVFLATDAEYEMLEKHAEDSGMNLSVFLRLAALNSCKE